MRRILTWVPVLLAALTLVACKWTEAEVVDAADQGSEFLKMIGGATGLAWASLGGTGLSTLVAWYRSKRGIEASKWVNAPKDANDIAEDLDAYEARPEALDRLAELMQKRGWDLKRVATPSAVAEAPKA